MLHTKNKIVYKIASKLPNTDTTIFTIMSALAQETNAINLSQGFPDFNPDKKLIALINKELKNNTHQYAPMAGNIGLREQIALKTEKLHGSIYHPDKEITITAGGTQAIFTAISALIKPNDEVIIFEPAYDCYAPTVKLMGGIVKSVELEPPFYKIDWDLVRRLLTAKTKLIMINSPNNPTGKILKQHDIDQLIKITANTDISILSDEVYEHLIYDDEPHLSVARYPELKERSFITASFGKLFHATGWKIGHCMAPEFLMKEFRKVHQFNVFSVNNTYQQAIASYLKKEEVYLSLPKFFQQKRDYFVNLMKETAFNLQESKGSYFITATYNQISDEDDLTFAKRLTKDFGVATIPVSAFYSKPKDFGVLRFCFAKKQETLEKAVERLLLVK